MGQQAKVEYVLSVGYAQDAMDSALDAEIIEAVGGDEFLVGTGTDLHTLDRDLSFEFDSADRAFTAQMAVSAMLVAKNVRHSLEIFRRDSALDVAGAAKAVSESL
jgi:hypothetical protein